MTNIPFFPNPINQTINRFLAFLSNGLLISAIAAPLTGRKNPVLTSTKLDNYQKPIVLIKDELYFGLSKPTGEEITETNWKKFLNLVVEPRFPEGFTILNADGQYMKTEEPAKVLVIFHSNSGKENQFMQEIIDKYKQQFQQQSVLRVSCLVTVLF